MNSPSFEPCRRALKQAETLSAPPTRERLYKVILQHLEANANGEYDLSSPQLASVVLETWKAGNDLRAEMEMRVGVRDEAVMNAVKEENKEEGGIHAVNEEAVTNTAHSSNPNPNTNLDHRPRPPSLRLRPKPNVGRRSRGTQTEAKRIRIPTTAKATVNCQNTLPNSTTAKANVHRQTLPNFLQILRWLASFLLPPLVVLLPRFWVPVLQYLWPHLTDVFGPLVKYILPLITGFLSPMAAQVADLFQQLVKTYCDAFHLSCTDNPLDCEPITTTTTITLPNLPCPPDCIVTSSTITLTGPCSLVDFDVLSSSVSVVFTSLPFLPHSAGSLFLPSNTYPAVILPSLFLPSSTCPPTPSLSVFLKSPLPSSPSFDSGFDLVATPSFDAKVHTLVTPSPLPQLSSVVFSSTSSPSTHAGSSLGVPSSVEANVYTSVLSSPLYYPSSVSLTSSSSLPSPSISFTVPPHPSLIDVIYLQPHELVFIVVVVVFTVLVVLFIFALVGLLGRCVHYFGRGVKKDLGFREDLSKMEKGEVTPEATDSIAASTPGAKPIPSTPLKQGVPTTAEPATKVEKIPKTTAPVEGYQNPELEDENRVKEEEPESSQAKTLTVESSFIPTLTNPSTRRLQPTDDQITILPLTGNPAPTTPETKDAPGEELLNAIQDTMETVNKNSRQVFGTQPKKD
jgi:hypothetical protein